MQPGRHPERGGWGLVCIISMLACWLLTGPALAFAPGTADTPYNVIGVDSEHAGMSGQGGENVDLFSGALNLTYTDVVIPGAFGLDMAVVRSYSSKVADETGTEIDYGWAGLGWHILPGGRLYFDSAAGTNYLWLDLPGSGRQRCYLLSTGDEPYYREGGDDDEFPNQDSGGSGLWMSKDFTFVYPSGTEVIDSTEYQLYSAITTAGVVYEFSVADTASDGWVYGTRIYNAYGDEITLSYDSSGEPGALSSMSDAQGRTISFSLDTDGFLDDLTYTDANGAAATVDYAVAQDTSYRYQLEAVTLPTGEVTSYAYYDGITDLWDGALELVTLPTGGSWTYTYDEVDFLWDYDLSASAEVVYTTAALSTRTHSPDVSSSFVWTYDYESYVPILVFDDRRSTTVGLPSGDEIDTEYYTYDYYIYSCLVDGKPSTCKEETAEHAIGVTLNVKWYDASDLLVPKRWLYYFYEDASASSPYPPNEIEIASIGMDPFDPLGSETPRILRQYYQLEISDSNNANDYHRYTACGSTGSYYDAFGNPYITLQTASNSNYGSSRYGESLVEYTWAWEDAVDGLALSGWNLVRLPASEAREQYNASTPTVFSEVAYDYSVAGRSEGWLERVDITAHPTTNPSADEYTAYSYDFPKGTDDTVEITVDHGGLRTSRRTFQDGQLSSMVWVDGAVGVTVLTQTIDAATGLVEAQTDANGDTTSFTYDALGRLTEIDLPLDQDIQVDYALTASPPTVTQSRTGVVGSQTVTTYDGLGRVVSTEADMGSSATAIAALEMDGLGRTSRVYLPYSGTGSASSYTDTTYDVLDRVTQVDRYDAATSTTVTATTDWTWPYRTYTNFRGSVTTTTLDGFRGPATVAPPDGVTLEVYDWGSNVNARIVEVYDGTTLVNQQVQYLDSSDRLWQLVDNQSGTRTFVRDASGALSYAYDSAGDYVVHEYDYQGRLDGTWLATSASPVGSETYDYVYDGDTIPGAPSTPSFTPTNPDSQLTGVADPAGGERYSYDDQGRVVDQQRWFDTLSTTFVATLSYEYDGEGNLDAFELSAGPLGRHRVEYRYGAGGRVEAGTSSDAITWVDPANSVTPIVDDVTWHPNGAVDTLALSNGVDQIFEIDGRGRPDRVYTAGATSGGVSADLDLVYTYDANDNVASVDDGSTDTFTYDSLDRLTAVDYGDDATEITYAWDASGNLETRDGDYTSLNFGTVSPRSFSNNQYTSFTYDAVGNLTDDGAVTYGYDARGQITSATDGSDSAAVIYDAEGRRVLRSVTSGGSTSYELFLYDIEGRLVARYTTPSASTTPKLAELYIHLGSLPVAVVDGSIANPGGEAKWLHPDLVGSVRLVTDDSGVVLAEREYHPFGEVRSESGSLPQDDIAFAGKESFDDFDIADFSARSLHAGLVGFTTPDRVAIGDISDPQSFNRYAYARMNPSSFVDPSGQVVSPVVIGLVEEAKSRAIEEFSNYAYDRSYAGEGLSADAWNLAGDAASLAYWYLNDAPLWVQAGGAVISGGAGAAVASGKIGKKVVNEAVEEAAEVAAQQAARGGPGARHIGDAVAEAMGPNAGKFGKCEECAAAAQKHFSDAGLSGTRVRIESEGPIGFEQADGIFRRVENNGVHEFVESGGRTYDNLNPTGMPTTEFNRRLDTSPGARTTVKRTDF